MTTRLFAIFSLILLACAGAATGAVIVVPTDQPTIQGALSAASNGDVIEVQPGVYAEQNLSFLGKSVTVTGVGTPDQIVVRADGLNPVFVFETAETATSVLANLTIENASFGVVIESGCAPVLEDLVLVGNSGAVLTYGDPSASGLHVEENWWGAWIGGGTPVFDDCVLKNNMTAVTVRTRVAAKSSRTGAIPPPPASVDPWAYDTAEKGEDGPFPQFTRCLVYGSLSDWAGGAFAAGGESETEIVGCTFYDNGANSGGLALSIFENALVTMTNTIVWEIVGGTAIDLTYVSSGALQAAHCVLKGTYDGTALFNEDPGMIDPDNEDFSLWAYSPCVNQGDPAILDSDGTASDIGVESFLLPGATDRHTWYVAATGDDLTGTGEASSPFARIQSAVNFANEGDDVLVQPGQLDEYAIHFWGKTVTVRGDGAANQVIVRGNALRDVFIFDTDDRVDTARLENLTVENGVNGVFVQVGNGATVVDVISRDNTQAGISVGGEIDVSGCTLTGNENGLNVLNGGAATADDLTASDNYTGFTMRGTGSFSNLLAEDNEYGFVVAVTDTTVATTFTDIDAMNNEEMGIELNGRLAATGLYAEGNKNGMYVESALRTTLDDVVAFDNDRRGIEVRKFIVMTNFRAEQNREGIFVVDGEPGMFLEDGITTRNSDKGLTLDGEAVVRDVESSINFSHGVVIASGSHTTLSDLVIHNNRGDGLSLSDSTIADNLDVHDNYRGMSVRGVSSPLVTNSKFYHNGHATPWNYQGPGLYIEGQSARARLRYCQIYDNFGSQGGGVFVNNGALADFVNCTIYGNVVGTEASPGQGEVVFMNDAASDVYLRNCIAWGHPEWADLYVTPNPNVLLIEYSATQTAWDGTGNITADPLFIDGPGFDFNLSLSSPCVDAGDPYEDYNDSDGTRNDMGALPLNQATYFETVLEDTDARVDDGVVKLTWDLAVVDEGTDWHVLRSTAGEEAYAPVNALVRMVAETVFEAVDSDVSAGASYDYRVTASDDKTTWTVFEAKALTTPQLPYALHQNYPNPFNPETTIRYDLHREGAVRLQIYDLAGRLVRTLVDSNAQSAGRHEVEWNGTDDRGRTLASGTYFYVVRSGDFEDSQRMLLVK